MNREQKRAWAIVIGMSLAVILSGVGFVAHRLGAGPPKPWIFIGAAVLATAVIISFRFKPGPGVVETDERDKQISKNANLAGFGAVYLLVVLVSYAPMAIAPERSIPVKWFPFLLPIAALCQAFAFFLAVLVQYGWTGKEAQDE
jgi:hypothetical protein